MTEYQQLLDAVEKYYGSGSDQWAEIAKYGIASDKAESILSQVPGVNIVTNSNGTIRSYNLTAAENVVSSAEQAVNSNVPAVVKSFDVPANTAIDAAGKMTFTSGMAQAGNFVFTEVIPAVAAVATGITLGKTIDKLLYSANPDFWNEKGMETLNPDTWGDIIGTDTAGERFLNMILGTTPDNKTQAYIDQNALAYMALYMQNKGVFNPGTSQSISAENTVEGTTIPSGMERIDSIVHEVRNKSGALTWHASDIFGTDTNGGTYRANLGNVPLGHNTKLTIVSSKNTNYLILSTDDPNYTRYSGFFGLTPDLEYIGGSGSSLASEYTYNGKTVINAFVSIEYHNIINPIINAINISDTLDYVLAHKIAWVLWYGNWNTIVTPTIDGIGTQEGAKTPDLSGATTVQEALDALKEQYPELFAQAVTQNVVQPDGSTVTYTYVPVAMPELDPEGNPISSTSTQANPQIDPATATAPLLDNITKLLQKDTPVDPPDTGSGDSPIVVPATGSASALYAIYNPTLSQINAFGAWLWSDNFIEQIKKLFNDPMQAIIGLHKVYATPATSGAQNIKVGYLDSGVSANVVSNQYTTIDCGTVTLSEYFHNVFDYSPYTQINLYLPFIGIVNLDNADVMRSSIHIVYHVDVFSGACLAEVKVTRDGAGGTIYQYTGNASVTLPISSGSYMGIVTSIASIAGGIAGTIASGGAALPMLASAAGSALNARAKVEHSGGFSGNAGAMGGKIPYLIISRPQVALANDFQKYIGYPANYTTKLSACSGYVKVLECHVENVNATNTELTEIESLLKEGVLI